MLVEKVGLSYQFVDAEGIAYYNENAPTLEGDDYKYLGGNPWAPSGQTPLDDRLGIQPNTYLYGASSQNIHVISQSYYLELVQANKLSYTSRTINGQTVWFSPSIYVGNRKFYYVVAREGLGATIWDTNTFAVIIDLERNRPSTLTEERELIPVSDLLYNRKDWRIVNLEINS